MIAPRENGRTSVVSFSGIDGSGKSTQIQALCTRLRADGLNVQLLRFWDDIAVLTQFRSAASHGFFKGDQGIGSPSAPVNRRDKNVRTRLMTGIRLCVYLLDAVSSRFAASRALRSGADLVIFDRFIYDELANLPLHNPIIQAYVRLIMALVPKPHISFLIDADPVRARARKPEYPIDFLHLNRQSYLDLTELVGGITVIESMPINEVKSAVLNHTLRTLSFNSTPRNKAGSVTSRDAGRDEDELSRPHNRRTGS